mgnify:CR=1
FEAIRSALVGIFPLTRLKRKEKKRINVSLPVGAKRRRNIEEQGA